MVAQVDGLFRDLYERGAIQKNRLHQRVLKKWSKPQMIKSLFVSLFLLSFIYVYCNIRDPIYDSVTSSNGSRRIAVMLQLGTNPHLLPELMTCTENVAAAVKKDNIETKIDLHISLLNGNNERIESEIRSRFCGVSSISTIYVNSFENVGMDMGAFLMQMVLMVQNGLSYDAVLKMHTKTDPIWRERILESLCGTPEQVRSILTKILDEDGGNDHPHMVAPLGTAFGPNSSLRDLFPRIADTYKLESTKPAFSAETILKMNWLRDTLTKDENSEFKEDELLLVAGSAFWINWVGLQPEMWARAYKDIYPLLSKLYAEDEGMEHAMERVIPSLVVSRGGTISDIQPAPKVFALYFPQYHRVPENDRFWGDGFTEWSILRPLEEMNPPLRKPLAWEEGGLGYYNLMDREVRKRQAEIARENGVQGFVYYHYWFSGSNAPPHHKVMAETLEAMLVDDEPDLPFMLSWANEPWTRQWTGGNGDTLLSQEYGEEGEWDEHFEYLLQFFNHRNYVRLHGEPVFIIYRTGHAGEAIMEPMIKRWRHLAIEEGFPGLHIIQTVGNFYKSDINTVSIARAAKLEASFHFWPQLLGAGFEGVGETASIADLKLGVNEENHIQYWGAFTGFDVRPRRREALPMLRSPDQFEQGLKDSFRAMSLYANRRVGTNFFFLTAWNEWNEQALLEPDSIYKFAYLDTLQRSLSSVPMRRLSPLNDIKVEVQVEAPSS